MATPRPVRTNKTEDQITSEVVERFEGTPDPRLRRIMQSLVRHAHAFVKDVELTEAEWFQAIQFLTRTGQMCSDKRQEFILLSDTLGISMVVDLICHRKDASLRWQIRSTTMEIPSVSDSRMNSWRLSEHICPVRVRNWIAWNHSASVSSTSFTNACAWRTKLCIIRRRRGSGVPSKRSTTSLVIWSSVLLVRTGRGVAMSVPLEISVDKTAAA